MFVENFCWEKVEHHLRANEKALADLVFEAEAEIDQEAGSAVAVSTVVVFDVCETHSDEAVGKEAVQIASWEIRDRNRTFTLGATIVLLLSKPIWNIGPIETH